MAKVRESRFQEADSVNECPTTLYHIYHSGPWTRSYSIHTSSDANTALRDKNPSNRSKNRRIRKYEALDNPRYDSRAETAPYHVHLPTILDYYPDFTLHRGGTKDTPVIALLRQPFFSRKWKLEFGDFPAQPGVIDSRRGVSLKHGTKTEEDGKLKSNGASKKFRVGGASDICTGIGRGTWRLGNGGKKIRYEQLENGCDNLVEEEEQEQEQKLEHKTIREGKEDAKPFKLEEIIYLSSKGWALFPFSHWHNPTLYQFSWRGWAFHWQRHKDSYSKRGLSLFVWLPWSETIQRAKLLRHCKTPPGLCKSGGEFLLLARFARRRIKRKVGRLEVLDANVEALGFMCLEREMGVVTVIEAENKMDGGENSEKGDALVDELDWLDEKLAALDEFSDQDNASVESVVRATSDGSENTARLRKRIHDVIVATVMCVIISERHIC